MAIRSRALTSLLLVLSCSLVSHAWAQTAELSASLRGLVRHEDGTYVDNIQILVRHENGQTWTTWSGNDGEYRFPALPPGRCTVVVELGADYQPIARPVVLHANRDEGLAITIQFRPATPAHVEVDSQQVETSIGVTTGREEIADRPLVNGRSWQAFQGWAPGLIFTESTLTGAEASAIGQRRSANRVTMDGINTELYVDVFGLKRAKNALAAAGQSGSQSVLGPLVTLETIDVRTVNAPLEHRSAPGAITTIVTRAGTDRLTVNLAGEGRPSALAAKDWFDHARGTRERTGYWNASGAAGGPLLPMRVHYLVAADWQQIERSRFGLIHVPSAAVRASAPPAIQRLLNSYPLPNGPAVDDAFLGAGAPAGFFATHARRFRSHADLSVASARVDVNLTPQHRLFTRVNLGRSAGPQRDPETHTEPESFTRTDMTSTRTVTTSITTTRGAFASDWRLNYSAHSGEVRDGPATAAGAQPLPFDLLAPALSSDDALVFVRFAPLLDTFVLAGRARAARHEQWQLVNTQSWQRGRHVWRWGGNYRQLLASTNAAPSRLTYSFDNPAALLEGRLASVLIEDLRPARTRRHMWAGFVQDTIRVSRSATVDLGLRLARSGAPTVRGQLQPLVVRYDALPRLEPLSTAEPFWRASVSASPQLSATYRLDAADGRETMMRATWGVIFDHIDGPGASSLTDDAPFRTRRLLRAGAFPLSPQQLAAAPPLVSDSVKYYAFAPTIRSPRTQVWSVGIDRELGRAHRVSLSYVGALSQFQSYDHGYEYFDLPQPVQVQAFASESASSYHGMLTHVVRRLSRGIEAHLVWTWSHAIDLNSGESVGPLPPPQYVAPNTNRGDADFDRRHVLRFQVSYRPDGERLPRWFRSIGHGWQIDATGVLQSGGPFSVVDQMEFPNGFQSVRPDVVPGLPQWLPDQSSPTGRRLNSAAFVLPAEPRQGTLGRNTLNSSPLRQVDLALSRSMRLAMGLRLQLRLEAFNVFNQPNFGLPDPFLQSELFGQPLASYGDGLGGRSLVGGGLDPLFQAGAARTIQFVVRLDY